MKIEILDDADAVAEEAAAIIATDARIAVAARGKFTRGRKRGPNTLGDDACLGSRHTDAMGQRARVTGG